jgi:chromosome segregation ATPase
MAKLNPLADKLSGLELGTESAIRNALLSDYIKNLENAKDIQYLLNYGKVTTGLDKILDKILADKELADEYAVEQRAQLAKFQLQQKLNELKAQVDRGEIGKEDYKSTYKFILDTFDEAIKKSENEELKANYKESVLQKQLNDLKARVDKGEIGGEDYKEEYNRLLKVFDDELRRIDNENLKIKYQDSQLQKQLDNIKARVDRGEIGNEDYKGTYKYIMDTFDNASKEIEADKVQAQIKADALQKRLLDLKARVDNGEIGNEDYKSTYKFILDALNEAIKNIDDNKNNVARLEAELRQNLADLKARVDSGEIGSEDYK